MNITTLRFLTGILLIMLSLQCEKSESITSGNDRHLEQPNLVAPGHESEQETPLMFRWSQVDEADSYQLQVAEAEEFTEVLIDSATDSTHMQLNELPDSTTLFWKVRPLKGSNYGPWSVTYNFTTLPTSDSTASMATTLVSPADGATDQPANPVLRWTPIDSAESYQVQMSQDKNFSSTLVDVQVDSSYLQVSDLSESQAYYWRVKPIAVGAETAWSEVFHFVTAAQNNEGDGETGTLRIMPLGDSITEAFGYRIVLWDKLTAAGYTVNYVGSQSDPHPELPDTDHEGHGGWSIAHIADKVNGWLSEYQPKYILLMIGTNDVAWWSVRNASQIADAHATLVDQILAHAPEDAWLLVASIPPQSSAVIEPNKVDRAQLAREFNAEMKQRMQERIESGKQIVFVDMHSELDVSHLSDGIHPNQRGYEIIAQAWFEALMSILP